MSSALIEKIYVSEGAELTSGSKILDFSIDLSSAFSQNCPPISYYRIVAREKVQVRQLLKAAGEYGVLDEPIALFSHDAAEPLGEVVARALRVMTAGIVHHEEMWSGR